MPARIGARREAAVMFERCLLHADAVGPGVTGNSRLQYALTVDDPQEGARIIRAAIPIAREHLAGSNQSLPLLGAAKIAAGCGSHRTAARLLGSFSHHGGRYAAQGAHEEYDRLVSQLTGELGPATFDDELGLGAQRSIGQALQVAEDVVAATAREARR
jgi:hypothetical protein